MLQPSVCGVVTAGIVPLLEEKVNQNGREGIMAEAGTLSRINTTISR
jgi:hypothetical protein